MTGVDVGNRVAGLDRRAARLPVIAISPRARAIGQAALSPKGPFPA